MMRATHGHGRTEARWLKYDIYRPRIRVDHRSDVVPAATEWQWAMRFSGLNAHGASQPTSISLLQEMASGIIGGEQLRRSNPRWHALLSAIRPPFVELLRMQCVLRNQVAAACNKFGLAPLAMYTRAKTIGSLARKVAYAHVAFPAQAEALIAEDFVGVTIVVNSIPALHLAMGALLSVGFCPDLGFRDNPRDYIKDGASVARPEVTPTEAITGNLLLLGFPHIVHFRVFTATGHAHVNADRAQYKARIARTIS